MAHPRNVPPATAEGPREPHSISLKVLRLSRPSFATQHSLPPPSTELAQSISPTASLAYPSEKSPTPFILSPLLTLPPSFGSAYVGESFGCTLCANNELPAEDGRRVHGVKIEAEMKTPSAVNPLEVAFVEQSGDELGVGRSLQGIVDFQLKEEGKHVLAVTVSYSETEATSGRVRSFRKLYQFEARVCLVVRTKIGRLPKGWALEAQLENCGDDTIVLESVGLGAKEWCKATSLNWEENPVLKPGDIQQVCFLIEKVKENMEDRLVVGILNIGWRGAMGSMGSLSTGWLGTRRL